MARRVDRVGELLREELSRLLTEDLRDPRLRTLVTITRVALSADLQHATVAISVMGGPEESKEALEGMVSATSKLRREIGQRLQLRYVPELRFTLDTSLEEGDRVLAIMDRLREEAPEAWAEETTEHA